MKIEDFKNLTPMEQEILLLLERAVKALEELVASDREFR